MDYYNFYYNDTHYLTDADEGLFIYLNGVGTFTGTDTATNSAGAYTETYKASVPNLTGTGHSGTNYFFMTGMLSASGSARE